ncbi:uncharacterized protein FOMMEDRAFT_154522 [Fomitiporia mediterranea MF3/22]|uniref:uncharacterized protein n=1 Tax=Fomitiporia mediterranea (strain MF3/22) TaxID=694068 RepID=UPI0004409539|nr:uncharacterized protein FOMMEDRAFT_154522 [Fomitiporia mediterranea MF3/22]EJD05291.1 hypothetical protein FOMMEDRAFT_154522 [Fomitiporia mediterranea MF3/22]
MPSTAAAQFGQSLRASTHLTSRRIALLYYDYALTVGLEVKHVWRGKFRISTILYFCCRYALIANVIYLLAIAKKLTTKYVNFWRRVPCVEGSFSCDTWYKFVAAISLLGRAAVIFALGARTYAVFNCNRYILALVCFIGVTCIGLSIVHVPGAKCVGANDNENDANAVLTAFYECLVAVLTVYRAVQEHRENGSWRNKEIGLYSLIFEQGLIYFCIVSIFTTATIVLNFTQPSGSFFQRLLNALTLPLSCLLTARFLLQLREWQEDRSRSIVTTFGGVNTTTTLPTPSFALNVDAIMMDDFGNHDQPVLSAPRTERDTTRVQQTDMEAGGLNGVIPR